MISKSNILILIEDSYCFGLIFFSVTYKNSKKLYEKLYEKF